MARASSAPATKQDIMLLKRDLRSLERATKADISNLGHDLRNDMRESQKETIRQFKFIAEQIHNDAIAANKETIDLHRNRIERIEKRLGIPHSLSA